MLAILAEIVQIQIKYTTKWLPIAIGVKGGTVTLETFYMSDLS